MFKENQKRKVPTSIFRPANASAGSRSIRTMLLEIGVYECERTRLSMYACVCD